MSPSNWTWQIQFLFFIIQVAWRKAPATPASHMFCTEITAMRSAGLQRGRVSREESLTLNFETNHKKSKKDTKKCKSKKIYNWKQCEKIIKSLKHQKFHYKPKNMKNFKDMILVEKNYICFQEGQNKKFMYFSQKKAILFFFNFQEYTLKPELFSPASFWERKNCQKKLQKKSEKAPFFQNSETYWKYLVCQKKILSS